MYEFSDEENENSVQSNSENEEGITEDESSDFSGEEDDSELSNTLRDELADIPLGELKELKNKIGLKKYNEALFGGNKTRDSKDNDDDDDVGVPEQNPRKRGRDTSHENTTFGVGGKPTKPPPNKTDSDKVAKLKSEPFEYSSKRKFSQGKPRVVVKSNKPSVRDPRFSDLSGQYNEELFEKSYSFVQEIKDKEYDSVKKRLKKTKDTDKRDELVKLKQKLDSDRKREDQKYVQKERARERKTEEIGKVKQGKKAFYLKKSDQKKIELAEKFRELKATGKYDSYMKNKRKRKATKEKRKLPAAKVV